jgi:stearoyl-CoA 9-desaturase NADPH oxidoreductase
MRHLGLDQHASFWLNELDPAWSLTELRARVLDIVDVTHDVKTFVFEPNRWWKGHRAGQFVSLDVEIDGVRTTRCYSLSSSPTDANPAITVKRVDGGLVSNWLHDRVRVGDVVGLGVASGDFVIPARVPEVMPRPILLLSGGSGATPVMSMLRERVALGIVDDIVYLHAARSAEDILFEHELEDMALQHPGLKLAFAIEDGSVNNVSMLTFHAGRIDAQLLASVVPDFAERETFLCGPAPMMDALTALWADGGIAERLKTERFSAPARAKVPAPGTVPKRVSLELVDSRRTVVADGERTLLEALEVAGEKPAYGCRMGICNTCVCRKKSGAVVDTTTGEVSTEADEDIRLCVSRALSDVELAF